MTHDEVTPINGWVLVLPDAPSAPNGLVLPASATNYGHTCGIVMRARETYYPKGYTGACAVKMPVAVGDRVACRDYLKGLETIKLSCGDCCFIYVDDILCTVDKEVHIG